MRCVNCLLRITRLQKHRLSELSDQLVEKVQKWVSPRNIIKEDCICHPCWGLLYTSNESEQEALPLLGHRAVCAGCGISILRKPSRQVLKPDMSETDTKIGNIISKWIRSRQLTINDKICIACYMRARRAALSTSKRPTSSRNLVDKTSDAVMVEQISPLLDKPAEQTTMTASRRAADIARRCIFSEANDILGEEENPEEETSAERISPERSIADEVDVEQGRPLQDRIAKQITLPTLRRAPATTNNCILLGCKYSERHRVPDILRKRILKNFNFFIPKCSRVCSFHLQRNLFHELYAAENAISTFTATQIEEIVFLLADDDTKEDFKNPELIDDHLFKYLFGQTKKEFNETLLEIPRLCIPKIKIGFCALLCKTLNRDSDERISALFKIPRTTLASYMKQAKEILSQYCDSVNPLSEA